MNGNDEKTTSKNWQKSFVRKQLTARPDLPNATFGKYQELHASKGRYFFVFRETRFFRPEKKTWFLPKIKPPEANRSLGAKSTASGVWESGGKSQP